MGVRTPSVGLGLAAETGAEARAVIALIAVALIARGATTAYHHVFIAFEAGREQLQLVALFRSLEVAAAAGALALGAGVVWVATIHAASWTLEAAAALARKRARLGRARPAPTAREVATAAPGLLGAGLAVAAGQWLLLGPLALARVAAPDLEAAGHFTLAWSAAVTLSLMLGAGLAAALPVLGRSHARADGKELLYLDACLRGGMLLAAAAGIGAGALGETVIRLAVGPGYGPAGGPSLLRCRSRDRF